MHVGLIEVEAFVAIAEVGGFHGPPACCASRSRPSAAASSCWSVAGRAALRAHSAGATLLTPGRGLPAVCPAGAGRRARRRGRRPDPARHGRRDADAGAGRHVGHDQADAAPARFSRHLSALAAGATHGPQRRGQRAGAAGRRAVGAALLPRYRAPASSRRWWPTSHWWLSARRVRGWSPAPATPRLPRGVPWFGFAGPARPYIRLLARQLAATHWMTPK